MRPATFLSVLIASAACADLDAPATAAGAGGKADEVVSVEAGQRFWSRHALGWVTLEVAGYNGNHRFEAGEQCSIGEAPADVYIGGVGGFTVSAEYRLWDSEPEPGGTRCPAWTVVTLPLGALASLERLWETSGDGSIRAGQPVVTAVRWVSLVNTGGSGGLPVSLGTNCSIADAKTVTAIAFDEKGNALLTYVPASRPGGSGCPEGARFVLPVSALIPAQP